MDEQKSQDSVKQLTDKELEEILRKSNEKAEFPQVEFDEFTPPTYEEWVEACNALLKGKPFDKIMYTNTYEGITFSPIYTKSTGPDAQEAILPTDDYPGMGDYLRGATVNGYKCAPWGIAQACDEIDRGSTVYNVRIDSATAEGIDVKDAKEPGDYGVSITTLEDMHTLLDGLDLENIPFMMYTGASSLRLLALVASALKAQGKDVSKLHGVIGANPIAQLVRNGKLSESLDKDYDDMAECIRWARKKCSRSAHCYGKK